MSPADSDSFESALARGRQVLPGVRLGRPGRARTYWATIAVLRLLKVRWSVTVHGSDRVRPGAAILVGNHVSAMDPVLAVIHHWWRVTAFTKVEVFERPGALFFRLMGQIPLRRGDAESTRWAMDMAGRTLQAGGKLGLYPEGTRSPDGRSLHRLHTRILVPLIQAHPDVPVHTIATTYSGSRGGRQRAQITLSSALPIDARAMDAQQIVDALLESLIRDGNLPYIDTYAQR